MKPAPPVTSAFPGPRDSAMAASLAPASVDVRALWPPETRRKAPTRRLSDVSLLRLLLRPLDGALELRLRHARATLDLQTLRLVVELLPRPRRAARGTARRAGARPPRRARARPRRRSGLRPRPGPRLRPRARAAAPRLRPGGRPAAPRLRAGGRATGPGARRRPALLRLLLLRGAGAVRVVVRPEELLADPDRRRGREPDRCAGRNLLRNRHPFGVVFSHVSVPLRFVERRDEPGHDLVAHDLRPVLSEPGAGRPGGVLGERNHGVAGRVPAAGRDRRQQRARAALPFLRRGRAVAVRRPAVRRVRERLACRHRRRARHRRGGRGLHGRAGAGTAAVGGLLDLVRLVLGHLFNPFRQELEPALARDSLLLELPLDRPVTSLIRSMSASFTVANVPAAASACSLISSAIWISRSKSTLPF